MEKIRLRSKLKWTLGVLLLPLAVLSLQLAFRFPNTIEHFYAQGLYPRIVHTFGAIGSVFPFSIAEVVLATSALVAPVTVFMLWRSHMPCSPSIWHRLIVFVLSYGWVAAGVLASSFLILWGFHYARLPLKARMHLSSDNILSPEILALSERSAKLTTVLHKSLAVPEKKPTSIPFSFKVLNTTIDQLFSEAQITGDPIRGRTIAAKRLFSSKILSYFGISGIFIPFTGEPSINVLIPDVLLPMVVAHEKAHQRGITREGEANFVAFITCSSNKAPKYLRYSAYLFATRYLLGEVSSYLSTKEFDTAWANLSAGPQRDIQAIREFWKRYDGPASRVASEINDGYLRTFRVDEGIQSYGTVVQLLVALHRQGDLFDTQ